MSVPNSKFYSSSDYNPSSQRHIPRSNAAALAARSHSADVTLPYNGLTTHYWTYDGKISATEILVLIHGFRGDYHGLLPIAEHLDDYRIIAVDLPGFGRAEPLLNERHDVDAYVRFLKEFLEAMRVDPQMDPRMGYILIGHSFGSIVASHFAAKYPQDVSKLILINPIAAPALGGRQKLLTGLALFYYRLSAFLPEKVGLSLLRSPIITNIMTKIMVKTKDPSIKDFIKRQHQKYFGAFANRTMVLEAFEASISRTVLDVASGIAAPTLLVAGELDEIVTVESQRKLEEAIPTAHLEVIAEVGHLIHYEKAFCAAQIIASFLSQQRSLEASPHDK